MKKIATLVVLVVTAFLTHAQSTSSTITATACGTYTVNGSSYTQTGQYQQTLVNKAGYDSVITVNLTIFPLPQPVVIPSKNTACVTDGNVQIALMPSINANSALTCSTPSMLNFNNQFMPSGNGRVSGNYTLTYNYTDVNGCNAKATANISTNFVNTPIPISNATLSYPIPSDLGFYVSNQNLTAVKWYDETLSTVVGTGNTYTPTIPRKGSTPDSLVAGMYSYYYTQTYMGCESQKATADLIITMCQSKAPIAGVRSNSCTSSNLNNVLTATAQGTGTLSWFPSSSTKLTLLGTGSNYITTVTTPGSYTYYVAEFTPSQQCYGPTTSVFLTINALPTITAIASPSNICKGINSLISATGASSYIWNNGLGSGSSKTVTPTLTTSYIVTGTDANGCKNTAAVGVIVFNLPTVSISLPTLNATTGNYCVGATAVPITCSPANSIVTGNGVSGNISNYVFNPSIASSGTYTINSSYTDGNGCVNTASTTVTVNPRPTITTTATPTAICMGISSILSAKSSNTGMSYIWNPFAGQVSPTSTTVYNVTGTDVNGCKMTSSVTVTVNPIPTVTVSNNNVSICNGSYAAITCKGASQYNWSSGITQGTTQVLTPTTSTTYIVTGVSANGCTNTAQTIVNIIPLPSITLLANPCYISQGESSLLTASSTGNNLHWSNSLTSTTQTVSPTTTTNYSVTAINQTYGCQNTASTKVIVSPLITINNTAGLLNTKISTANRSSVISLKITGTIDARDFKTMRDSLPNLTNIDLSEASIVAYNGQLGTSTTSSFTANTIPLSAFQSKTTLYSVALPFTTTKIDGDYNTYSKGAFYGCTGLNTITIPASISLIGYFAFYNCTTLNTVAVFSNQPASLSYYSPNIPNNIFYNVNFTTCNLLVPYNSSSSYKNATQWKDFNNIVEFGAWNGTGTWYQTSNWLNNILPMQGSTITNQTGELTLNHVSTLNNITINPNAKMTLSKGDTLKVINGFSIKSSALGSGSFVDNGTTVGADSSSVQLYLSSGRNWYISSPVTTAKSIVVKSTAANKLWSNDESTQTWNEIANATTALSTMKGYIANVANTGIITFNGNVNTGTQTISLDRTGTVNTSRGFNLIGNPYPSCVNWELATKTNLEPSIWYRTKNTSNAYVFDTYNADSHIGTNNNGNGAVTKYIPPMQAVWVRVNADNVSGQLTFDNTMRSHPNSNTLKADNTTTHIRLNVSNDKNSDETILVFNEQASNGYDSFDSEKMFATSKDMPEMYSIADAEKLVINGMKPVDSSKVIPLGFKTLKAGTFTISATEIAGLENVTVTLEDKHLNKTQDLTLSPTYTFASDSVNDTARFVIHLKGDSGPFSESLSNMAYSLLDATDIESKNISMYKSNGQLYIQSTSSTIRSVTMFDILGQPLVNKIGTGTKLSFDLPNVSGAYYIKIETNGFIVTKKIVVE